MKKRNELKNKKIKKKSFSLLLVNYSFSKNNKEKKKNKRSLVYKYIKRIEMELRIADEYRIIHKIGGGAFGEIYSAENINDGTLCAVKLEKTEKKPQQLFFEYKVYSLFLNEIGFPKIYHYGIEGEYNTLVMQLLGPSLEDLIKKKRTLSLISVCLIAEQLISRFEIIHSKSIVHRDIKPNNFLLQDDIIHVIDFGLAKRYRRFETRQHIPMRENYGLVGTARYCSLHAHLGYELSRRDDMESLGYLFVYLLKGKLPWQDLPSDDSHYSHILQLKKETSIEDLCDGLPEQFAQYLYYSKQLSFTDKPDYHSLRKLFHQLLISIEPNKSLWHIQ